jgi:hypothetical protein
LLDIDDRTRNYDKTGKPVAVGTTRLVHFGEYGVAEDTDKQGNLTYRAYTTQGERDGYYMKLDPQIKRGVTGMRGMEGTAPMGQEEYILLCAHFPQFYDQAAENGEVTYPGQNRLNSNFSSIIGQIGLDGAN